MNQGIAIVGGGIAAQAVAEAIRKIDQTVRVTMISAESRLPYDRVRLSELLVSGADAASLQLRPAEWYLDNNIDVILSSKVDWIDSEAGALAFGAQTLRFDRACIATGSVAMVPPIPGIDRSGVFTFRGPEDCDAIRAAAINARHAAVIGGGLLGLEAARAVESQSCPVTVVHLMDRLMERQLDAGAAAMLNRSMEQLGVDVLLNKSTKEVVGDQWVSGLRFADDEHLECDLVVVSVGIKPNIDLALAADLACERGILADDQMRTSAANIFTVGECAQHDGIVYGIVAPIYEQATVAAQAMLDSTEGPIYGGSIMSAKLKVMGVDLVSIGEAEGDHAAVVENRDGSVYRKLILRDGRVAGAILMGDTRGHELLLESARRGEEVLDPLDLLASASAATVAELPDSAQICNCNGVCKGEIVKAINAGGLTSTQEVVAVTRAGAGCGSCKPIVTELVALETGQTGDQPTFVCPCRKLTREDVAATIREHELVSVSQIGSQCGAGRDCGACKPALAYLVSEINDNQHQEERGARFINDRVHANIQNDGTFSVVPRIYGGVTTPAELRRIADVADQFDVPMVKITGGQRIDLLGVPKEQLPAIWEALDMPSGHAYAKAVRTVKTCVGENFCRFGLGDSIALGIEMEKEWEGLHTPHKVKGAVSGCPRNCAEASTKDIAIIIVEGGFQVRIGGAAGASVREGDILATVESKAQAMRVMSTFLQYYREHGEYLERTYGFIERVGLETIKAAVLDEESGVPAQLRERMRLAKAAVTDPWLERRKPVHRNQFAQIDSQAQPFAVTDHRELAAVGPPSDGALR